MAAFIIGLGIGIMSILESKPITVLTDGVHSMLDKVADLQTQYEEWKVKKEQEKRRIKKEYKK